MPMLPDPSRKYKSVIPIDLPDRQWPSKRLTKAPRWLSTDLRDGNQSLKEPMSVSQKLEYFNMLVNIGYKEIEVSFPCASDTEWNFTRHLVDNPQLVPDDVWLQVLAPSKPDLITRTIEAIRGAKRAIIHFYIASSDQFQKIVLGMSEHDTIELVVKCAQLIKHLTTDLNPKNSPSQKVHTIWRLQFSLEAFQDTDPAFAVRICEAVKSVWQPTETDPIIFTLAATVESHTPNIYADQIEYFSTHISERSKVTVCAHPHNDRGCAVAAAEQAQLAGADRIEGCLFGNGERTGNVDLVTLALNLYTQGISPNLDFSKMSQIIHLVERFNKISVHPRAPYAGKLVYCTFAGSHQDGIKKGWRSRLQDGDLEKRWNMPYLPIDPADLGQQEEEIIRISSQSGKSGGAWIIEHALGLELPRGLQSEFLFLFKKRSDHLGHELSGPEVVELFEKEYLSLGQGSHGSLFPGVSKTSSTVKLGNKTTRRTDSLPLPNATRCSDSSRPLNALESLDRELAEVVLTPDEASHGIEFLVQSLNQKGLNLTIRDARSQRLGSSFGFRHVSYLEGTTDNKIHRWSVGIHEKEAFAHINSILKLLSRL